ncbi:MAG: hypothetical protein ACRD29_14870 [Acidimicrobiales bacterium]
MTSCATARRGRPRSATARLVRLAEIIDLTFADRGAGADTTGDADAAAPTGHLIGVIGSLRQENGELAVRPLDVHPVDFLLGHIAPPTWSVLGVRTSGRARHRNLDSQGEAAQDTSNPVRLTYLVSRSGASVAICREPGSEPRHRFANGLRDAARGRVDDVLRRALLLPTHPPESGPIDLWARLWLDAVLAAASAEPGCTWSWTDVVRLHPGVAVIAEAAPDLEREAIERIGRVGALQARARSWADLRSACAAGSWAVEAVPADVAAWMDDGSFSRWVLDDLPECADLATALGDLLPTAIAQRMTDTLAGWRLIPTEAPRE